MTSHLLLAIIPLVFAAQMAAGQGRHSEPHSGIDLSLLPSVYSTDPAAMGAQLGKELAAKLSFMSYPKREDRVFTAADFPPSLFASMGLQVNPLLSFPLGV